jgi:hypothetical protein
VERGYWKERRCYALRATRYAQRATRNALRATRYAQRATRNAEESATQESPLRELGSSQPQGSVGSEKTSNCGVGVSSYRNERESGSRK